MEHSKPPVTVKGTLKPIQRRLKAAIDTDLLSFYTTLQATLTSCATYDTDGPLAFARETCLLPKWPG